MAFILLVPCHVYLGEDTKQLTLHFHTGLEFLRVPGHIKFELRILGLGFRIERYTKN